MTVNSLTFSTGSTLTLNPEQNLVNSSGGVLVQAGNATITGGVLSDTNGTSPLTIWTFNNTVNSTTSSLTINSVMSGGNGQVNANVGLVKAGAGELIISSPRSYVIAGMGGNTMTGQTVITQGTLTLSGGTNTLSFDNYLESARWDVEPEWHVPDGLCPVHRRFLRQWGRHNHWRHECQQHPGREL